MAMDSTPLFNTRPVVFGEVLFDRFTDATTGQVTEVLGGAPFNVAWHLHAFGQAPRLVSRVGADALGERIRQAMRAQAMDTTGLQSDDAHPTGTVEVRLVDGEPSYDILAERAYDFIAAATLPTSGASGLLYHGTLAARHPVSAAALNNLRASAGEGIFVDVNLRAPWWTQDAVLELIRGARWIKLNAEELTQLAPSGDTARARAQALLEQHALHTVFVTLGAQGAFALRADGEYCQLSPPRVERFVDAVGAGDGFASVLILGLLRAWPLATTLERAQAFASAILGQRGATTQNAAFYQAFTKRWELA